MTGYALKNAVWVTAFTLVISLAATRGYALPVVETTDGGSDNAFALSSSISEFNATLYSDAFANSAENNTFTTLSRSLHFPGFNQIVSELGGAGDVGTVGSTGGGGFSMPEPATLTLLGSGIAALIARRRLARR
jgi:hypothetical protein